MAAMTTDQIEKCDALSRRIAELAPHGAWAMPGMAALDHETGILWRYSHDNTLQGPAWATYSLKTSGSFHAPTLEHHPSLWRAVTICGPSWRDSVTLNAFLGDYGAVTEGWNAWSVRLQAPCWDTADTRPEAILTAKVAWLEVAQGSKVVRQEKTL